jgi:hypothetical protein
MYIKKGQGWILKRFSPGTEPEWKRDGEKIEVYQEEPHRLVVLLSLNVFMELVA